MTPLARQHYEPRLAAARRLLAAPLFAATWAEGQTLDLEQPVALGLHDLPLPAAVPVPVAAPAPPRRPFPPLRPFPRPSPPSSPHPERPG